MKEADAQNLERQLDQWRARLNESQMRIDAMNAGMAKLDTESIASYDAPLKVLQDKVDHARRQVEEGQSRLDALRRSTDSAEHGGQAGSESAWETFTTGLEAAWDDLKGALDQAVSKLGKPTAGNESGGRETRNESGENHRRPETPP